MPTRKVPCVEIAVTALVLLSQIGMAISADYGLELTFDQEFSSGGQKVYSVRAAFRTDDVNNRIVAPNGRVFDFRNQYAEPLTAQQFQETAFGRWTATTASSFIAFEIPTVGLDSMAFATPVITSPTPGSEVPEMFTINWQGKERGFVEFGNQTNLAFRTAFHPAECCSTTLDYDLINPGKGWLELRVYERTFLPTPQITTQRPAGTDTFTLQALVRSFTAPVSYTVVPEPRGALLAAMAALAIFSIRRR